MMTESSNQFSLQRIAPLAGIAIAAILGFVFLRDHLTFATLAENHEALSAWRDANYVLAAAAFIILYVVFVALSLPGALFVTLGGGFLFGLFPGVLYVVSAATIGAAAIFWAARLGLGDFLQSKLDQSDGLFTRIRNGIQENEISFLFLMRLVPAVPFFAANLIPALVGASFRNFLFTTFFGIIPGSIVYTWVGSGLGAVFASGEKPSLGIIWEWQILGPILGLCALAALPILLKAIRKGDQ